MAAWTRAGWWWWGVSKQPGLDSGTRYQNTKPNKTPWPDRLAERKICSDRKHGAKRARTARWLPAEGRVKKGSCWGIDYPPQSKVFSSPLKCDSMRGPPTWLLVTYLKGLVERKLSPKGAAQEVAVPKEPRVVLRESATLPSWPSAALSHPPSHPPVHCCCSWALHSHTLPSLLRLFALPQRPSLISSFRVVTGSLPVLSQRFKALCIQVYVTDMVCFPCSLFCVTEQ